MLTLSVLPGVRDSSAAMRAMPALHPVGGTSGAMTLSLNPASCWNCSTVIGLLSYCRPWRNGKRAENMRTCASLNGNGLGKNVHGLLARITPHALGELLVEDLGWIPTCAARETMCVRCLIKSPKLCDHANKINK